MRLIESQDQSARDIQIFKKEHQKTQCWWVVTKEYSSHVLCAIKNKTQRSKTNQSKKTTLILSAYHIRVVFSSLATMLLRLFGVAGFTTWLYDIIHFLWSRSPFHTVVLCTQIWSIPEKVAQSLSKNSPKQSTPKSIMPRQHAWWYRSTIWRKKRKANISELCLFPILKIISWRTYKSTQTLKENDKVVVETIIINQFSCHYK